MTIERHIIRNAFSLHLYGDCGVPTGNIGGNYSVSRFFSTALSLRLYGDCGVPTENIGGNKNVSPPVSAVPPEIYVSVGASMRL